MGIMLVTKNTPFVNVVILCLFVSFVGAEGQSESEVISTSLIPETVTEKECDCGPHGECELDSNGNKECACDVGYEVKNGFCEECYCGKNGWCRFNQSEKVCRCPYTHAVKDGICTECTCSLPLIEGQDLKLECSFENGVEICKCSKGYKNENSKCIDIDECLDPTSCHNDTHCENYPGFYLCFCKDGYTGINDDAKTYGCRDIDECVEYKACPHNESTNCINTNGSFYCECKPGYSNSYGLESSIRIIGCSKDGLGTGYIILIVVAVIVVVAAVALIVKKLFFK